VHDFAKEIDLTANVLVIDERRAILEMAPVLEELAVRCGQPGSMNWLDYFLHTATAKRKKAFLVLVLQDEYSGRGDLEVSDIRGASMFFEYRLLGCRTGILSTDDASGFRTLVAAEVDRASVAAIAVKTMVERGAHVVLTTTEGHMHRNDIVRELATITGVQWARKHRFVKKSLVLGANLDETLAGLTKEARFKLRYYRRRLEKSVSCELLENAGSLLSQSELHALNKRSLNPVPSKEFDLRLRNASAPGGYLLGLRTADGRWLALVGGWRQGNMSVLHWQLNSSGYEKDSIGTVMRSYFLEHEIALGMSRLMIYGGTPHSIRHAFQSEPVADLVIRRQSIRAFVFRAIGPMLTSSKGLLDRGNFLAQTICSKELNWHRTVTDRYGEERARIAFADHARPAGLSVAAGNKIDMA
jgi:hypothetical protein